MTCWAIIPVKAGDDAKSRLAGVLDPSERAALVDAMLAHVARACGAASNIARVCVVGPSRRGLHADIPLLSDPGGGLNAALAAALEDALRAGAGRVILIAADLPSVTPRELEMLADASAGTVAIAPDRHGTGTNALSLPLPDAKGFVFAFGADSFSRHSAEAQRHGLHVEVVHSPGLASDIDEPDDLKDAAILLKPRAGAK